MTRCRSSRRSWRRSHVPLDQVRQATADAVDSGAAQVLQRRRDRHRRLHRDPEPAAEHPQRAADRDSGRPRQGAGGQDADRQAGAARRRRGGRARYQPLIGDAIIDGGPGLLLVVEKLPWANSLQMTAGSSGRSGNSSRACPESSSTRRSSGRPTSSSWRSHNLSQALVLGFILVVAILLAVPVRMAGRPHQRADHSAVADGDACSCSTGVGATINTMTLAGLVIALGAVVDDAIIDVENITGGCARNAGSEGGTVNGGDHPQGRAGGAQPDRLRDVHHRRRRRSRSSCCTG